MKLVAMQDESMARMTHQCTYTFVCRGAGSSVCMELRRFHFCSSQCLVSSVFPFLQKERTQTGKPCTWTQMKQLSTGMDDVAGELPEDIWLMRGSCRSERQSRSLTHFEMVCSRVIIDTFV